jgi:putative ABC transport system permease protein
MLTRIAWRNVWRNKVRSLVLVTSVALGIWAGIFILAFSYGMSIQYVNIAIEGQISHIQLHQPDYKKEKKIKYNIPEASPIMQKIEALPEVKSVTDRTIVNGMVSSVSSGVGAIITGINPPKEDAVTKLQSHLTEGNYFTGEKKNQVIVGEKLAKKLNVKLNHKIVLTFQDIEGNITSGAFRISGIYKTHNSAFDETHVFVNADELNPLLGLDPEATHEIAVLLKENHDLKIISGKLRGMFPELLVEDWQQIAPELQFVIGSFTQTMYLIISIILLALIFGIVNTMLMAVLERVRELGILMAIGMNKVKVFFMIMYETLYMALLGGIIGMILAYGTIHIFGRTGINLSAFSSGLSAYGMDPIVYTTLPNQQYLEIFGMVFIAALLAAIYPSIKALQLKPVNAIRKI